MFNYSVDTILFANFIFLNQKIKYALEIGTNNAALAIFLAARNEALKIDAVEIQKRAILIAEKNLEFNKMKNQINLINQDFNLFYKEHAKNVRQKYQMIFVNPPYYPMESSIIPNSSESKLIATHEVKLNLEQIILGSSKIIEQKGYLNFVIPVERFVDLVTLLRKYKFEPKRIQFIYPRIHEKAKFVMLESRYNSGYGQHYLENLYLHPEDINDHSYLENIKELYIPKKVEHE
ncbi:tRNA1(Val) (adenine(37)-N6)-methyltransferase [Mycoplasmopsis agassizii]|nr:methyltransferase [Mycoplasmopsis agassizii]SMC16717.1 tRNA1Val (adenine37-N6)-methyltransferase [Mycoplasmopsis agassizii]